MSAIDQDITVAALLANCLTIENGSQTQLFFQDPMEPFRLETPTLEDYFNGC
jgi:hypothetical protein